MHNSFLTFSLEIHFYINISFISCIEYVTLGEKRVLFIGSSITNVHLSFEAEDCEFNDPWQNKLSPELICARDSIGPTR